MAVQPFTLTPPQKRFVTAGYYGSFLAVGLVTASLGPALPYLAEKAQVSLSAISILFASRSMGRILGALLSGKLYDHFRGHSLLILSLTILGLTTVLIPLPAILWGLILITFLNGIAQGMINVGGNTLLVWLHGAKFAPWMNGLHGFFGIGSMIAPILITWIFSAGGGLNWAFLSIAMLMLPACLLVFRAPAVLPQPAVRENSTNARTVPMMVLLIAIFFFCYAGTLQTFGGWIYTYALEMSITGPQMAGVLTSLYWGVFTFGRLVSIPLSRKLRCETMLWGGLAGSFIAILILMGLPANPTAIWSGTILLGVCLAPLFAAMMAFAEQKMHITAQVNSWFNVGHSIGLLVIPWLVGQFFESAGPQVMFLFLMSTTMIGAAMLLILITTSRHQTKNAQPLLQESK